MTIRHRIEIAVAVATMAGVMAYLSTTPDTKIEVVALLVMTWSMWCVARFELPEFPRYVLCTALMFPAAVIVHLVDVGMPYVLFALPALIRAGILVSFHRSLQAGLKLIIHDMRYVLER